MFTVTISQIPDSDAQKSYTKSPAIQISSSVTQIPSEKIQISSMENPVTQISSVENPVTQIPTILQPIGSNLNFKISGANIIHNFNIVKKIIKENLKNANIKGVILIYFKEEDQMPIYSQCGLWPDIKTLSDGVDDYVKAPIITTKKMIREAKNDMEKFCRQEKLKYEEFNDGFHLPFNKDIMYEDYILVVNRDSCGIRGLKHTIFIHTTLVGQTRSCSIGKNEPGFINIQCDTYRNNGIYNIVTPINSEDIKELRDVPCPYFKFKE